MPVANAHSHIFTFIGIIHIEKHSKHELTQQPGSNDLSQWTQSTVIESITGESTRMKLERRINRNHVRVEQQYFDVWWMMVVVVVVMVSSHRQVPPRRVKRIKLDNEWIEKRDIILNWIDYSIGDSTIVDWESHWRDYIDDCCLCIGADQVFCVRMANK